MTSWVENTSEKLLEIRFCTDIEKLQIAFETLPEAAPYCLHRDIYWLKEAASRILIHLGAQLELTEKECGPISKRARKQQRVFGAAHRIFHRFNLCDKDRNMWFPRNRKRQQRIIITSREEIESSKIPGGPNLFER